MTHRGKHNQATKMLDLSDRDSEAALMKMTQKVRVSTISEITSEKTELEKRK